LLSYALNFKNNINTRHSFCLFFFYQENQTFQKTKMFTFKAISLLFLLFAFSSLVQAIVINPTITVPNANTKWRAGGTFVVKWETTYNDGEKQVAIPSAQKGYIKLGYLENDDPYNEHLLWDLASDFNLDSGAQSITLPSDLETKRTYIIVLMGDSGNASPKFTIRAARS
jgi:hypothetical protein